MKTLQDAAAKQELLSRLSRLCPDTPRRWGRMNAAQMVCHLSDSFKCLVGEKTASALQIPGWRILKFVALHTSLPWMHGVKTRPEMDQEIGGTRPTSFDSDIRELRRILDRFTGSPRDFQWQNHPMFPILSDWERYRWGYAHMHHHLRQFGL
jgi:hypothetical protein